MFLIAHTGTGLFETVIQTIVFLGPVPVIFFFFIRAMRRDDDDSER
jgi:hypothetical protein